MPQDLFAGIPKATAPAPSAPPTDLFAGIPKASVTVLPESLAKLTPAAPYAPPDVLERILPTVLRVAPAVVGGAVGSLAGPAGTAVGGGLGSGLGELLAEGLETRTGTRDEINPWAVAGSAAFGAVPVLGRASGSLLKTAAGRGLQGAALAGGQDAALQIAEGRTPTLEGVGTAAVLGAAMGVGAGAAEALALRPRASNAPRITADLPTVPDVDLFVGIPKVAPVAEAPPTHVAASGPASETVSEVPAAPFRLRTDPAEINQQTFYHGTGTSGLNPDALDVSVTQPEGLFGQGVYLTDNPDIAGGYAKTRGKKTGTPITYEARVNVSNVLNLEEAVPTPIAQIFQREARRLTESFGDYSVEAMVTQALAKPGATTEDLMLAFRNGVSDISHANQIPTSEFYDTFGDLSTAMKQAGYDALTHTGGRRTGKAPHQVLILLDPNDRFAGTGRVGQVTSFAPRVPPPPAVSTAGPPSWPPPTMDAARAEAAAAQPSTRKIEQVASAMGDPIPAQKPLDADRIAGEQKFLETQPEPFREGLSAILDKNHFEAQRRGVQPVARTNALAQYLQAERKIALPKGTALNAEELTAYKNHVATSMDRTTTLAEKVRAAEASPVEQAQLLQSVQETVTLLSNAMGARAEAGRALNALKGMAQVLATRDVAAYEQLLKAAKRGGLDPTKLAQTFAELPDDIAKMNYLRSLNQAGVMDWVKGTFYSNILSGPRTHVRNLLGNTTNAVFRTLSQPAAYAWDAARSAVTSQPRTMFAREALPRTVGLTVGVKQGIDDAFFALRHGYTRMNLGTFDTARKELQGGGLNPINWTGRALEAEDQFFYSVNYNAALHARLYAKARQTGLKGRALTDQVADWTLSPPADIAKAANQEALNAVYKEQGGKVIEGLTTLKAKVPALDFVMPFVRTPGNILRQGLEATPLGLATAQTRQALAAGGREQSEAIGRMFTGTAALSGLAWWAANGLISGTGPSDPEQRAALMENGWKPNAVHIGNTWITFADLAQPLAQPLFAIANAYEAYAKGQSFDPSQVAMAAGNSLLDQSFLSGVSDLNSALSDPERFGNQFKHRLVQSAVPFSGTLRNITQAIDPVVRDPKTTTDAIKSIVPGLSTDVAPKIGRLGQEITRDGGTAARALSPSNIGQPSKDPVIAELSRRKVDNLGLPPKDLDATKVFPAIQLTIAERQQIGQAKRTALERLFSNPGYAALGDAQAKELIKSAVKRASDTVTQQIRVERQRNARR